MSDLPELESPPAWVSHDSGSIRLPFAGEGAGPWQMAGAAVALTLMLGLAPMYASLLVVFLPAVLGLVRRQGAPRLALYRDTLELTLPGGITRLPRGSVRGARLSREGRDWALALETDQGLFSLERTGATPAQLQWAADLVMGWQQGARRIPAPPASVVEQGLGAVTFVSSPPLSWAARLLLGLLTAGLAAVVLALVVIYDQPGALVSLLAVPQGALLGYLFGQLERAHTEIQVRDQALLIQEHGLRSRQRTVALEDVRAVRVQPESVELELAAERVTLPARGCAEAMAQAIEARRAELAARPEAAAPDEARARLAQLAQLRDRSRA